MVEALLDRGLLPDRLTRVGIRRLLRRRIAEERERARRRLPAELRHGPIAVATGRANDQHYEQPAEFFRLMLGPWMKYSCGWWSGSDNLARAEAEMLRLTCERAGLEDGMTVLDLGCGWGSLTAWIAEHYPRCRVLAVSNSRSQRQFVAGRVTGDEGLRVEVRTADINEFDPGQRFDRVISVEMFEHLRNYRELLRRIAGWLEPEGKLFVHHFCHRELVYTYQRDGNHDWMARHFFTGGVMPSRSLLREFNDHLHVERDWTVCGTHYARTLEAWLERVDLHRDEIVEIFAGVHGAGQGRRWLSRWRVFVMACAELFAYEGGEQWQVAHVLLGRGVSR